jgi:hypothetical protein
MFIERAGVLSLFRKERKPGISFCAEIIRRKHRTIEISPLCGDDSVHILREPIQEL